MSRTSPALAVAAAGLLSATGVHAQGAPQVDLDTISRRGGTYVAKLEAGGVAELTLAPALQEGMERMLADNQVPFGAAVAVSIPDGRVLALAGHSTQDPALGPADLALRPWAPAASVFKVVAAAALVEAGIHADSRVCYHGGSSSVLATNLVDVPRLDRQCDTLAYAVGKSQNAIIAKMAARHLTPARLTRTAEAFGFGREIPFDVAVEPSEITVPTEKLEFARAAAGFWHTSLSPLHGALLAAAVANAGEMPAPRLISRAVRPDGRVIPLPHRRSTRVLAPAVAREVGEMMVMTTSMGTARTAFHDRRGRALLPFEVAGKTGSLSFRGEDHDPTLPGPLPADNHLAYSWFVGFAPATKPRIAFAVILGNAAKWRVKAANVAQRLVSDYAALGKDGRAGAVAAR